ncbi:MAG: tRNA 2-thiouridine(34) synthase MnmA [Saccharofermentans sp.]|nr:tRNA 2-thiouridine(34) synthase MnmA [Saccharofermentans sp.]
MSKVIVGMSGGVDSAVAAYLLKEQGYEVMGVTLRTWGSDEDGDSRCCEIDEARRICEILGIKYHPHNCTSLFRQNVVTPFIDAYLQGMTPNPCIECNRYVKWAKLIELADIFEAEYVATGHYAYIEKMANGRFTVRKALHTGKDQTYMLYKLTQEQLSRTLMPLGKFTKDEVRKIAEEAGLPCAHKEESQEICFVTEGRYSDFICGNTDRQIPREGNFVDEDGNILGRHKGIYQYTVGQRKGLGIALGYPAFVTRIDTVNNTVVLGTEDALMCDSFLCREVNFLSIPEPSEGEKIRCFAKARYHQTERPATLEKLSGDQVRVALDEAVKGVSPGQSAVFYDENGCVVGGGVIVRD